MASRSVLGRCPDAGRPDVVVCGINEDQPDDLVRVGAGVEASDQAAEGVAGQHVRPRDCGRGQQGMQVSDDVARGARHRHGSGSVDCPVDLQEGFPRGEHHVFECRAGEQRGFDKKDIYRVVVVLSLDGGFSATPEENLKPGEYLLTFGSENTGYDFGISPAKR